MSIHTPSENREHPFSFARIESLWTQAASSESPEDIKRYLLELDSYLERLDILPPEKRNFDEETREELMNQITSLVTDEEGCILDKPKVPIDTVMKLRLSPNRVKDVFPD